MFYSLVCKCGEKKEVMKGMNEEFTPEMKACPKCSKEMRRDYAADNAGLIIPENMKATAKQSFDYSGMELPLAQGDI